MSVWSKVFGICVVGFYVVAFVVCWAVIGGKLPGTNFLEHAAWFVAVGLMLSLGVIAAAAITTGVIRLIVNKCKGRS